MRREPRRCPRRMSAGPRKRPSTWNGRTRSRPELRSSLVEANSGHHSGPDGGVQTATGIAGVSVVTMSWSGSEYSMLHRLTTASSRPQGSRSWPPAETTASSAACSIRHRPPTSSRSGGRRSRSTPAAIPGRDPLVRHQRRFQLDRAGTQLSTLGPVHRLAEHARRRVRRQSRHRGRGLLDGPVQRSGLVDDRRGNEPRRPGPGPP